MDVCTVIIDSEENVYLRMCNYSGEKDTWKEVIKDQLIQHLKDLGVENGFVRSETHYFEVSKEQHYQKKQNEIKLLDLIARVNRNFI